jgi:hypothetical protein
MQSIGLVFKAFWAPAEAMFLTSKNPKVLVPLIVLTAFALGTGLASFTKIDFGDVVRQQLERTRQGQSMPEEQKQNIVRIYRSFAPAIVVAGAAFPAILVTIATVVYFGIFTMLGRDGNFKAFYAVTVLAYTPLIVRQIVAAIQLFAIPSSQLDLNDLGNLSGQLFLDPTSGSKMLYALAGVVDVTSLWIIILLCIGYKTVTRKSLGTALRVAAVCVPYVIVSFLLGAVRALQAG